MFCIAAFLVLGILALFSASYRPLAAKAWHCVWVRLRLKPCDINFAEEMKGRILAKLIFRHPRLAKFIDRWIDWLAFAFVALSIWSLVYALNAGLNLWVYDTCNPASAESCSLSGEACGVQQETLGLIQAVRENREIEWASGPFVRTYQTLTRIPDRLKTWEPKEFLAPTAAFYHAEDPAKPYALEIIDPGCQFCRKLTGNLLAAGTMNTHNVSFLLYPIPVPGEANGTKFANSTLMAAYIEATKRVPLTAGNSDVSPAWRLLEEIFSPEPIDGLDRQTWFNTGYTRAQAEQTLKDLLKKIGYDDAQVQRIAALAASDEVKKSLQDQKTIVEERIRTIKIPTLLIDGRRYDRVVGVEKLRR